MGAVLAIFVLGTLGGLLWLQVLMANERANPGVTVTVETPDGVVFEGLVGARSPLGALERAGDAAGFAVARSADGERLLAAAGRVQGTGGAWQFSVARDGEELRAPGEEASFALSSGDAVRWTWVPA